MPRLDLRPPPVRGPLTPREVRLAEALLALLNELRAALGLAPRTMHDIEQYLKEQEKGQP